jgi:MFS transporter, NNP family, nitrate/nitrite transporter
MTSAIDTPAADTREHYRLSGSPTLGLAMGTWGFFVGFAAVALYGPAAKYFQEQMNLGGLALGLLVAAPQRVASFSVGIPQVSYWYPQSRQGTALGVYGGIGNLAPGVFTLLLPYAIGSWGLAGSYFSWLTFLLVGAAVYAWLARDAYFFQLRQQGFDSEASRKIAAQKGQQLFPNERVWQAVISAAEEPRTWGLVALYFVSFGGFLALTAWFPIYWIDLHHMDVKSAAMLGGLGFSVLAAVTRVFGGVISESIGGERTAVLAFIAVLAGALMLTLVKDFSAALGGELLIALGMGVANAAVFKMVPKYVPEAVGGAAGIVGGLGALGGFIIPPFLGAVVDALGEQGYAGGFFAYVLLAVMAVGVSAYFWHLDRGFNVARPAAVPAR